MLMVGVPSLGRLGRNAAMQWVMQLWPRNPVRASCGYERPRTTRPNQVPSAC